MYDHMNHHCPVRSTISRPAGVKAGIDKTDRQPTRESCCGHVCSSTAWHTQPSEVLPDSKPNIFRHARGTVWRAPTIDVPLSPSILGSLITLCTAWPLLVIDHLLMRWPIMKKLERHMTPSVTGQRSNRLAFRSVPHFRCSLVYKFAAAQSWFGRRRLGSTDFFFVDTAPRYCPHCRSPHRHQDTYARDDTTQFK